MGMKVSGARVRAALLWLLGTTAWIACSPDAGLAQSAQPSVRGAAAPQTGVYRFDIPAKPLARAIADVGALTGWRILYTTNISSATTSRPLVGTFTPAQALSRLIAGTGLTLRVTGPRSATLSRPGEASMQVGAPVARGVVALEPVNVEATGETAWGPVKGTIATRSAAGTKTDTPIIETPRSVSVITRDQLDARGVQDMVEAVRYTAGVTTGAFGFDPRFDQIYIRGFNAYNFGDFRDGTRQGSGSFALFRTEPYGLERIDIIKGPASVLYGQTTPGGLIDRISKRPTDTPLREAELSGGNFERFQGAFDFSDRLDPDGKLAFRLTGLARDSGSQLLGGRDDRLFLAPAITWRPDSDTTLTVLGQVQKDKFPTSTYYEQAGGVLTKVRDSDPSYDRSNQLQYQAGYLLEHRFDETWTVRQRARYGHVDVDAQFLSNNHTDVGTIVNRDAWKYQETLDTAVIDNQVQAKVATGPVQHTVLAGLDYQWIKFSTGTGIGPGPSIDTANPIYGMAVTVPEITFRDLTEMKQIGFYAQDQMKLGGWRLTLGGRYDKVNQVKNDFTAGTTIDKDDAAFTGQAGLLYLLDNGLAPYVSYSTSFQPNNVVDFTGKLLDPTRGEQYEAGVKYQPPGTRAVITFSAYQLTEQGASRAVPGTLFFDQTGAIRVRGFEIEGAANPIPGLDLIAAYTFNDAVVTQTNDPTELGRVPPVTPRHVASLWADYTLQTGALAGFGFGAGVRHLSETFADVQNTQTNEPQTLVDAAVHYDFGKLRPELKGLRLNIKATNLFDREVPICNGGEGQPAPICYWSQGRTVIASMRFRW